MSKLSSVLRGGEDGRLFFVCPGCRQAHSIQYGGGRGPRWHWDGDVDKPTFAPSILIRYDCLSPEARNRSEAFQAEHGRYPTHAELPYDVHVVCHSFVEAGRIRFLADCSHRMAGQTVDLPAFTEQPT